MFFFLKYIDIEMYQKQEEKNVEISNNGNKTLLINPNCPIGIIKDYLQNQLLIPDDQPFDLCTEKGKQIKLNEISVIESGLEILKEREIYYVILPNNLDETPSILTPLLSKQSKEYSDFMLLQKKRSSIIKMRKGSSTKSRDALSNSSSTTKQ
ncbi:uncharacterized protein LOC143206539 [Rhynchophorus ferrugineus]|uniref:Uncharacterized protein n=1 Tax=Rhynchophorus ferrugineus TaxID=354439 RepID=A0A834HPI1_RHYFE|nr:hypothetical protein GWI33_021148 [Rhynchophorus ferrugineus]